MRYELKSIAVWPFVKVSFFFNLIAGFIIGLFYALFIGFFMSVFSNIPAMDTGEFDVGQLSVGFLMVFLPIVMSIGMATFNTILGVIFVLVYNLITRLTGGLELNLNLIQDEKFPPVQTPPATGYTSPPPPSATTQPTASPLPPSPGLKPEPPLHPSKDTGNDHLKPDNPENTQL